MLNESLARSSRPSDYADPKPKDAAYRAVIAAGRAERLTALVAKAHSGERLFEPGRIEPTILIRCDQCSESEMTDAGDMPPGWVRMDHYGDDGKRETYRCETCAAMKVEAGLFS